MLTFITIPEYEFSGFGGVRLHAASGALFDIGQNPSEALVGMLISESADIIKPVINSARVDLSVGTVRLVASETIDATPSTFVNLGSLFIANTQGDNEVPLLGATVTVQDSVNVDIQLTEAMRVRAIEISATSGGDSGAAFFELLANGVRDLSGNGVLAQSLTLSETADTVKPVPIHGELFLGTGIIRLFFSETIDATPSSRVDLSKIFVANAAGAESIGLSGSNVSAVDSTSVNITVTEASRVAAIEISGLSGGDGQAAVLDFRADAVADIATNGNLAVTGVNLVEVSDLTPPVIKAGYLDLNTGVLIMTTSETIDGTPASNIDISRIYLNNAGNDRILGLTVDPYASLSTTTGLAVATAADDLQIQITLTEVQRKIAIEMSGTAGGDGGAVTLTVDAGFFKDIAQVQNVAATTIAVYETADTTAPTIASATLYLAEGLLVIRASEILDVTPASSRVNLGTLYLSNSAGGTDISLSGALVTEYDDISINVTLSEAQRVAAIESSGTTGGDGNALVLNCGGSTFKDIAGNGNTAATGVAVSEIADQVAPVLMGANVSYSTGAVSLLFSEHLDNSPASSKIDLSQIIISNSQSVPSDTSLKATMEGATVNEVDGYYLNLVLPEDKRAKLLRLSGVAGGDSSAVWVYTGAGAVKDIAQNANELVTMRVTEFPDTVAPQVNSAT